MKQNQPIHPIHPSLYPRGVRVPHNMERARGVPRELTDDLTRIAVGIFTDCTNVGVPFQTALLAIYLSGLQHGHALAQEDDQ